MLGTAVGAVAGLVTSVFVGSGHGYITLLFGLYGGGLGLLLATGFSVIIAVLGEREAVGELSPRRAAFLGGAAGAVLPLLWLVAPVGELLTDLTALPLPLFLQALLASGAACATLGAGLAAGSVAVARRAPDPQIPGQSLHDTKILGAPGEI
jgi:hypothetical protein